MRSLIFLLLTLSPLLCFGDQQRQMVLALELSKPSEPAAEAAATYTLNVPFDTQPKTGGSAYALPRNAIKTAPRVYSKECVSGSCYRVYRQPQRVWRRRY
jgi:hypothetical protein